MRLVGIGDLHLESPLKRLIPEYNDLVLQCLDKVVRQGVSKGAEGVILYGDISHYPGKDTLSDDTLAGLTALFSRFPDVNFFVIAGNHDRRSGEDSSLDFLQSLSAGAQNLIPNLGVFTQPRCFKNQKINFLPFPHTDTKPGFLNVLHIDCKGSKMDTGREVTEGFSTDNFCVSGHLHTSQRVRNIHFSGTLHQTTFGENPDKFYHLIDWDGDESTARVKLVPFQAPYRLINVVIGKDSDYDDFQVNYKADESTPFPTVYYKVFVSRQVILPTDPFGKLPRVLKTNQFASKAELKAAMAEELSLEMGDTANTEFDTSSVTRDWMVTNDIPPSLQDRVLSTLEGLLK